jgi:dihydrodipicolinate synthase/N-acetylneuraminate lyase
MPMTTQPLDPIHMLRPRRQITGISAMLLPFTASGAIDWPAFERHVSRTAGVALVPAVNMDTGYVNLLDEDTRLQVLHHARQVMGGQPFVAGAFVADRPGSRFDRDAYLRQIEPILDHGATPVIFQSYGLTEQADDEIVSSYSELARHCGRMGFIAFELGTMFAPFGKIYSLEVYRGLLGIKPCIGAKHSSLSRELEWQRLILRDEVRPDFHVFTGNDLGIDMVMYGSDYLLGLSTFAPELFARRDGYWLAGDPRFYALNDVLQYLGFFAFRAPVPAYKHSAAMFLHLCGRIGSDRTHPQNPQRPASDREVLREIGRQLDLAMEG